jgi:predicted methyltransferase
MPDAHTVAPLARCLTVATLSALLAVAAAAGDERERPIPEHLAAAVANPLRPDQDQRRDPSRRPAEVLAFLGIEPGMKVGELMAGTGYYTEILAAAVGRGGNVYAQNNRFVLERYADKPWTERLERPGLVNVVRLDRELEEPGFPAGLDAVLLIRFYHDACWMKTDRARMNRAVLEALSPGGIYGIVDHHAAPGSRDRDVFDLHRVDAEMVKEEVRAAGFLLEAESALLSNPKDDRSVSVFADEGKNRDRSDRFVLRFRKPSR